jgi:probable DNA metabolism protein
MVEMKKKTILDLLSRNPTCSKEFQREVCKEDRERLENVGSELAKKALKIAREVQRDSYRIQQFTRLTHSSHGILFATISPQFHVEDLVIKWFWKRFPQFVIALESTSKKGVFLLGPEFSDVIFANAKLKDVIRELEEILPVNPLLKEIPEFSEVLWENVYASQYIPSRKNLKLFLKWIPKKYHKWKGLTTEANFGNRRLDEFMD